MVCCKELSYGCLPGDAGDLDPHLDRSREHLYLNISHKIVWKLLLQFFILSTTLKRNRTLMLLLSVLSTDLWQLVYFLETLFEFSRATSKCFIRDSMKFLEVPHRRIRSIFCSLFHVFINGTKS